MLSNEFKEINEVEDVASPRLPARDDGRRLNRKGVTADKIQTFPTVTQASIASQAVGVAQLKYEAITVTITAGQPSGTASVTSGDVVLGFRQIAVDQVIKSIVVSGTTLTVTLNANATAQNQIQVILLKV